MGTGHDCAAICRQKYASREERTQLIASLLDGDIAATNIEEIKLAAIGQRNKLSATRESQAKEEKELKQKVLERQEELERLKAEFDSLCKVRDEQESMIEKLAEHAM